MVERLQYLMKNYANASCSASEYQELITYIREGKHEEEFYKLIDEEYGNVEKEQVPDINWEQLYDHAIKEGDLNRIKGEKDISVKSVHRIHFLKTAWFRYAAAVLFIMVGVWLYWWTKPAGNSSIATATGNQGQEILPGGNRAMLTLADGSTIVLDTATNGILALQGDAKVVKLANGQIAYSGGGQGDGASLMNTMSTPKGGQYQVILPDGSKVWLNASSSISYPASFTGTSRRVMVSGEVYFEISQDKAHPFVVDVDGKSEVEVLGTEFNINSYPDEAGIRTTLFEGSVKVKGTGEEALLKPGQQAEQLRATSRISVNDNPNTEQVAAWRKGIFYFNNISLKAAMRQISRWYDVEVIFEKNAPDIEFWGKMQRDLTLQQVLKALEKSEVHFRVEGKKLIVMP